MRGLGGRSDVAVAVFRPDSSRLSGRVHRNRHAKAAMGAMSVNKSDRNDARALAQVVRSGWFKVVHVKSAESQELRTLLVTREFLVNKVRDHENEVRGVLRPFGLKVGHVSAGEFEARARELCEGWARLLMCIDALLWARRSARAALAAPSRAPAGGPER